MHQDFLLIPTHLGATIGPIQRAFHANSETSLNTNSFIYASPMDLNNLKVNCNQTKKSRVLVDILFLNHLIQTTAITELCIFLYYLGDPQRTMTSLVYEHKYTPIKAYDYYAFRLQRIATMARNTPNSMILTWDNMNDSMSKEISSKLHLKNTLYFSIEAEDKVEKATGKIADKFCVVYEKYLNQMRDVNENNHHDVLP